MNTYNQLVKDQSSFLAVMKNELDCKSNCIPFAMKALTALKGAKISNAQAELNVANAFLSGMQTLISAGFTAEDYDVIDFVPRGGVIVPSGRVEGLYRACARKGYRIADDIVAVPIEDAKTTYYKEEFYQGSIFYVLEDKRFNTDREITAERIVDGYFDKFLCRLTITEIATNKVISCKITEMSVDEIMKIASSSDSGIYKSNWVNSTNDYGRQVRKKQITTDINVGSIWHKWTSEMVSKSIIRRSLKRIKDTLPQALQMSVYSFESQENIVATQEVQAPEQKPLIPIEQTKVELKNLTDEQKQDCKEMLDIFKSNPKLAGVEIENIQSLIDKGIAKQDIINNYYAILFCLSKIKSKWIENFPKVGELYE